MSAPQLMKYISVDMMHHQFNNYWKGYRNMKKMLIILMFLIVNVGTSFSAFEDIGIGARPYGMGGAFVAIADDATAPMYNPAGIDYIKKPELGFTYLDIISGAVNYNYAGIVVPSKKVGSFGLSFGMLSDDSSIYSEKSIAFSYSKRIIENLSLGANLKMLSTGFSSDNEWIKENPYFVETSSSGFTIDAGMLAKPVPGLNIGLSAQNIVPVDVSISESNEDKVPMNLRFGIAYNFASIAKSAQQPALQEVLETTNISFEGAMRKEREVSSMKVKVGIEAWFANQMLGLRAGYNMKKVHDNSSSFTIGASIKVPISKTALRLDYALQIFNIDAQEKMSNRVSLSVSI